MQTTYRTNLNCVRCVAKVTPFLDGDPQIEQWSVDTESPDKVLTITGHSVTREQVSRHVAAAGFQVLDAMHDVSSATSVPAQRTFWQTYHPLLLIVGYLLGIVILLELRAPEIDLMRAMTHFMGGFFLAFSFFKLLDLPGFATAYQTYDVLAHRSLAYGYVYPFLELGLGIAYLAGWAPMATNTVTLFLMILGLVGVTEAIVAERRIQCACLGTVFNLPMSTVTFVEDGVMAVMALVMLLRG